MNNFRKFCEDRSWYTIVVFLGFAFWTAMVMTVGAADGYSMGTKIELILFYAIPSIVAYLGGKEEGAKTS